MIYKNKEGEIINVKFPKREGKFIIPEFIGDYQCKVIETEEFVSWSELTEVIIPKSVEVIRRAAFCNCWRATITLKKRWNEFESYAPDAFRGCRKVVVSC